MEAVNEQAYCVDLYVYVMCIMCHSEAAICIWCFNYVSTSKQVLELVRYLHESTVSVWTDRESRGTIWILKWGKVVILSRWLLHTHTEYISTFALHWSTYIYYFTLYVFTYMWDNGETLGW